MYSYLGTDNKRLDIYINKSTSLISKVDKSSMRNTLEQFDKSIDGTLDPNIKLLCVYSIKNHLRKYVKFDWPKCGTTGDAFHMKIHIANCERIN